MSTAPVSRRNQINKKGNKENAQPGPGSKSTINRDFAKSAAAVPFQQKGNEKEDKLFKTGSFKTTTRQVDPKSAAGEVLKKSTQKDVRGAAVTDVKQRRVVTEQTVRHKAMVAEAPKPAAPLPQTKPAPGLYKGKIVQSKIGAIWKSGTAAAGGADVKPPAPKTENARVGNWAKNRSKSVAEIPRRGARNPAPLRSKSVLDGRAQVSKPPAAGSRPPAAFRSTRPPARTVPATLTSTSTSTRNTTVAPSKASGTQKPRMPVTDKKVSKPPVTSSLSQYRTTETLEERRAKLAEWMASKGKTFKRPAMATTAAAAAAAAAAPPPPKTKVPTKPKSDPKAPSQPPAEVRQTGPRHKPEPAPKPLEEELEDAAAVCVDTQGGGSLTNSRTPGIMNTTLDLLETSDDQPSESEGRVEDIVVNLCDALDAMETPSRCEDELPLVTDECNGVEKEEDDQREEDELNEEDDQREEDELNEEDEVKDECQEELNTEKPQDLCESVAEQLRDEDAKSVEKVESDVEESDDDEEDDDDEDDDEVMESTPQPEEASVIKYSVKTTPFLQSVKKTIEEEVGASASRGKSNIKDLKFLTPVRRSSRIHRQSSRLPPMLVDHDPCVSSLAELVMLDDDSNAYIYRKNTALLEDLPDQSAQ